MKLWRPVSNYSVKLTPKTAGDIHLAEHAPLTLRCTQPSQPATVDCGESKKVELSREVFIGYPYCYVFSFRKLVDIPLIQEGGDSMYGAVLVS